MILTVDAVSIQQTVLGHINFRRLQVVNSATCGIFDNKSINCWGIL